MAVFSSHPKSPSSSHSRASSTISIQHVLEEDSRGMAESPEIKPKSASMPANSDDGYLAPGAGSEGLYRHLSSDSTPVPSSPPTPGLSRSTSFSDFDESIPPLDRLTVFDFLENLALPQRLERLSSTISLQSDKVRRSAERVKSFGGSTKEKVVEEWRRRVPGSEEQLEKYKRRMKKAVDQLNNTWKDQKSVTLWEKMSFMAAVLNIFVSGYLIGGYPELFHWWYTAQLLYFMPIRLYTYKKRGYHYFLADLCYFVNLLCLLSIWVFPRSKRLLISTYCLAFGNNAIAIAMWRNSLVFHSMDKVTSLFIHIMPCATLHCIVHLIPKEMQRTRFPAVYNIAYSSKDSPEHYTLPQMMLWATIPYAVWQISYYSLITVRRREQIAAGRPTSFTWLRRTFAPTWIGKLVLGLPETLQESAFMCIQYLYALLTMVPCPLWFWFRWASGLFLAAVFAYSIYNGATYYIDIFGMRFQKELEQLKKDVAKWQSTPDFGARAGPGSPLFTPADGDNTAKQLGMGSISLGSPAQEKTDGEAVPVQNSMMTGIDGSVVPTTKGSAGDRSNSLDKIPPLDPIKVGNESGDQKQQKKNQ